MNQKLWQQAGFQIQTRANDMSLNPIEYIQRIEEKLETKIETIDAKHEGQIYSLKNKLMGQNAYLVGMEKDNQHNFERLTESAKKVNEMIQQYANKTDELYDKYSETKAQKKVYKMVSKFALPVLLFIFMIFVLIPDSIEHKIFSLIK